MKLFKPGIIIIFLILLIRPIGSMLFLPSLPALQGAFSIDQAHSQMSISVYAISLGLSQIIYGPLSDKYGRKHILIGGLMLFLSGSFLCMFATNIKDFLFFRMIQGIGLGCDFCITSGIMTDMLPRKKELAKVQSLAEGVFGLSILSFPFIGGYIQNYFGWKAQFSVMAMYSLILILISYFYLSETQTKKESGKKFMVWLKESYKLFSFKYLGLLFVLFIMNGYFFSFCSISSFIAQKQMGCTAHKYGIMMLFLGGAYVLGTLSNYFYLEFVRIRTIYFSGFFLYFVGSALAIAAIIMHMNNIYALFIPIIIATFSTGFIVPQITADLLLYMPERAATSGSAIGVIYNFGQGGVLAITSYLHVNSIVSLGILMNVTWVVMLAAFLLSMMRHSFVTAKIFASN